MAANVIVNVLILEEIERRHRINFHRIMIRDLRDHSDPFQIPDRQFIKCFRLSKHCCHDLITILTPHMRIPQRNTSIPIYIKILTTLHLLGHGSYQHGVGACYALGLSQPSVSRCLQEVVRVINNYVLREKVKFPTSQESRNEKRNRFRIAYGMDGIIGAIDCTHISIIAPPEEDPDFPGRVYYSRRGYPTINTQIICDSDLRILNVNARFPGSTHDSAIWELSTIRTHLLNKYINNELNNDFIIGDSGYPLEPWLMTPVDGAVQGTPEFDYNQMHISARNCIERLNGVLKSRFRCLLRHRVLNYNPLKAAFIINACAALHNLAIEYNVDLPVDYDDQVDDPNAQPRPAQNANVLFPAQHGRWYVDGQRRRNALIQRINIM